MERDEILKRLHNIDLQISLTVMPSEYAIEVNAITRNGVVYYWCGMDDWCAYKFNGVEASRWSVIKKKLSNNILGFEDLSETELVNILPEGESDCNAFFTGLKDLPEECPSEIYCFYDGEATPVFYNDECDMVEVLESFMQGSLTRWEDMDTQELISTLDNYEAGVEIPYINFD